MSKLTEVVKRKVTKTEVGGVVLATVGVLLSHGLPGVLILLGILMVYLDVSRKTKESNGVESTVVTTVPTKSVEDDEAAVVEEVDNENTSRVPVSDSVVTDPTVVTD